MFDVYLPNVPRTRYSWHHIVKSLVVGQMRPGTYPILDREDVEICHAAFDFLDRALDLDPYTRYISGMLSRWQELTLQI